MLLALAPPPRRSRFASAGSTARPTWASRRPAALPAEWRLVWCADSSGVRFVPQDSPAGCTADESNEVTFNGGIDGPYPPTVLSTASDHSTRVLHVTLRGADLGGIQGVGISSPDLPQGVALSVMHQSAAELVAEAYVPLPLQPTDLRVATANGEYAQGTIPGDPVAPLGGPFAAKFAGSPVTDIASSSWTQTPTSLFDYLHMLPTSPEFGFQASEILQIGGTYYWAAYDGNGLLFRKLTWGGTPHFWLTTADLVAVSELGARGAMRLSLAELLPGRGRARLRLDLPVRTRASVVLYDVMGRAVRTLADREFGAGASELAWDGRGASGAKLGSGMYFARLLAGEDSHVVRVPFIR